MLEKQDETIKVIRVESEKTRNELGKEMDSIDLLRSDLRSIWNLTSKRYTRR